MLRRVVFGIFGSPRSARKHSWELSLGHSEPGAQKHSKALFGALSGPGPGHSCKSMAAGSTKLTNKVPWPGREVKRPNLE